MQTIILMEASCLSQPNSFDGNPSCLYCGTKNVSTINCISLAKGLSKENNIARVNLTGKTNIEIFMHDEPSDSIIADVLKLIPSNYSVQFFKWKELTLN